MLRDFRPVPSHKLQHADQNSVDKKVRLKPEFQKARMPRIVIVLFLPVARVFEMLEAHIESQSIAGLFDSASKVIHATKCLLR